MESMTCMVQPPETLFAAPDLLAATATALERGDRRTARIALATIDVEACAAYWSECDMRLAERHRDDAHTYSGVVAKANVTADMRREITTRDGWRCRYCTLRVVDGRFFTRLTQALPDVFHDTVGGVPNAIWRIFRFVPDHIVPLSAGGLNDAETNLVTSCGACNYPGKFSCLLEELQMGDPFSRAPIVDGWSGLKDRLK
jgi:hypothetical protein